MSRVRWAGIGATAAGLAAALFLVLSSPVRSSGPITLRVGIDHSPPFYSIHPDGKIDGLAVDVLNEAARRRHIRLEWVPLHDIPLDDALHRRIVQLWPLVGGTPERRKQFYMSQPWLESEYILVSLRDHPLRNAAEAAGKVVAHARLKLTKMVADQYLSRSRELVRIYREQAIQSLCTGEADAALVESRVLDAVLLSRPAGCEKASFQISTLAGATTPLAIMAVPEVRAAAAALREEIHNLATDGFLSMKLDQWSPFSAEGTRSVWAEEEANKRSNVYRACLVVIFFLAVGLAWFAIRAWKLKGKAESADAGRREAQRRFSAFMDNSPALAFMKDVSGRMLYVNRALSQLIGKSNQDCVGKDDFELWPARVAEDLRSADLRVLTENKPLQLIERIPAAPFDIRDLLVIKFPFSSETGEKFIGGTAIDITDRQQALRALAASEMRYRELFEQNPVPAWVCDRDSLAFLMVNIAAIERYGWSREDFLSGMTLHDLLATEAGDNRHRTRDGLVLTVDTTTYAMEFEGRNACLMIVRDLTELESTLDQLRVSEERWQFALHGAGDGLWDWDLRTGRIFRSPRWFAMLGYDESDIRDTHNDFVALLHPDDVEPTLTAVTAYLDRKVPVFCAEYRLRHKDGTWHWIMDRGQGVWDDRGKPIRMAGSHTDITSRKTLEDILSLQARTDALTGLPNRWEFEKIFDELVIAARGTGTPLTLCACDLDRFKAVNDTYGHATGDNVLITFGKTLRRQLRKADILARIGGDEFVIAMPDTTAEEAREVIERIRHHFSEHLFVCQGEHFHVSSSFGVAPLRTAHRTAEDLLAEADRCLYDAKEAGRDKTLVAA